MLSAPRYWYQNQFHKPTASFVLYGATYPMCTLFYWEAGIINECCPGEDQIAERWLISEAVGNSHGYTW